MKRMPPKQAEVGPQLDPRHVMARPNTPYTDDDARTIAPILAAIEKRDGVVKPQAIIDEARKEDSPLHRYFEWDNAKAAEKYRRHVAATMARAICYRVRLSGPEALNYQPMLVRVQDETPKGKQTGYVSMIRALKEPDLRWQVIDNARWEVDRFIQRYSTVEALTGALPIAKKLREAIDEAAAEMAEKEAAVAEAG